MMQIHITGQDGEKRDFSQFWSTLKWSGSKKDCCRVAEITLPAADTDNYLPHAPVGMGNRVHIEEDGKVLLDGFAVKVTMVSDAGTKTVRIHDRGWYLNRSDGVYNFQNTTPAAAVHRVCGDFDIPVGDLPDTGDFRLTRKFVGVSLYKILATFYSRASAQTGVHYCLRFEGEKFCVRELKRRENTPQILPGVNLVTSNVAESIENVVNRVLILDKNGNTQLTREDGDSQNQYGLGQKTLKQADGAVRQADKLLREGKDPSYQISVTALGDTRLIAGECVLVQDRATGLWGVFAIDSDSHTWANGYYSTQLTLTLQNVMQEVNAGTD